MARKAVAALMLAVLTPLLACCDASSSADGKGIPTPKSAGTTEAGETGTEEPGSAEVAVGAPVCSDGDFDPGRIGRLQRADKALRANLRANLRGGRSADAVALARRAAASGDFRLIGRMTVKGIATEPYGARCRLLGGLSPWMARVVDFAEDGGSAGRAAGAGGLESFGRAYNATMLADARYPFGDVCRAYSGPPVALDQSDSLFKFGQHTYGYRDLAEPPRPPDIWQAARRGSVARLQALLKARPEALDRPDMFGLTPLAWAIAYRRWNAADFLLKRGASPSGSRCQGLVDRDSPMQVARTMRWSGMIWRMRPLVTEDDFASLRQLPRADDLSLDEFNKVLTDLRKDYAVQLKTKKFARHDMIFAVDKNGKSLECRLEPGTSFEAFDKALCDKAIEVLHWAPGRDAFGITVPADAKLILGLGDA